MLHQIFFLESSPFYILPPLTFLMFVSVVSLSLFLLVIPQDNICHFFLFAKMERRCFSLIQYFKVAALQVYILAGLFNCWRNALKDCGCLLDNVLSFSAKYIAVCETLKRANNCRLRLYYYFCCCYMKFSRKRKLLLFQKLLLFFCLKNKSYWFNLLSIGLKGCCTERNV